MIAKCASWMSPALEVLPDRGDTSAQPDVFAIGGLARCRAAWVPSVTKWNVVPPSMTSGFRKYEVIVNTSFAASLSRHIVEGASRENPLLQGEATGTRRIVEVLVWADAKAIERYREVIDAELSHSWRIQRTFLQKLLGEASHC